LKAYTAIGKNPLALSSLIHNWRETPIIDIKAVTGSCTSGYTPMIQRKWPGTKTGCNCDGSISLKSGKCPKGCEDVESKSPIEITKFFGKTICIKRSGENIIKAVRPDPNDPTKCETKDTGFQP
jgi:hypothetical protein